jgi:fumarate hydratase subunit beta
MPRRLAIADLAQQIPTLKAGDELLLTGTLYTARDAAHKRLAALIAEGKPLPIEPTTSIIYYCGPAPARPGDAVGPCGPTTSARMDPYTPKLLSLGVKATVGKGKRTPAIAAACREHQAIYCVAIGGVGALLAQRVRSSEIVAFPDLGPEAIWKFEVEDFPVVVAIDSQGTDIFAG